MIKCVGLNMHLDRCIIMICVFFTNHTVVLFTYAYNVQSCTHNIMSQVTGSTHVRNILPFQSTITSRISKISDQQRSLPKVLIRKTLNMCTSKCCSV